MQSHSLEAIEPFNDTDCVATLAHPFLSHAVSRIERSSYQRLFSEMLPITPMYRAAKSSTKMSLVDVPWRGLPGTLDLEKGYFLSWNGQAYRFPAHVMETGINLQLVGFIEGEQFHIISGLSKNEPLDETGLDAASQFFAPGLVTIAPTVMCVSASVFDPQLAYVDPTISTATRICAVSYKRNKPGLNEILLGFLSLL